MSPLLSTFSGKAETHYTYMTNMEEEGDMDRMISMSDAENSSTWDLIDLLSKYEKIDVYNMFLKRYKRCKEETGGISPNGAATTTTTTTTTSVPRNKIFVMISVDHFDELLQTKLFQLLFDKDEINELTAIWNRDIQKEKEARKRKMKSIDRLRFQKTTADLQVVCNQMIQDNQLTHVSALHQYGDFILFFYLYQLKQLSKSIKDNNSKDQRKIKSLDSYLDICFSLRDAFCYMEDGLWDPFKKICLKKIHEYGNRIPIFYFLMKKSHLLIRNHFNTFFEDTMKPFPEQELLIQSIHQDPFRLFVLSWGVGCGKTASVAPLSTIYTGMNMQTIYCVPNGPIRDQTSANLLRCGIPFAFIHQEETTKEFFFQPSFHCSYQKGQEIQPIPQVLVSDYTFVRMYLEYWDNRSHTNGQQLPIRFSCPSKRYRHLTNETVWNQNMVLILDEPDPDSEDLLQIMSLLPRTTIIMSATHCSDLMNEKHERVYRERHTEASVLRIEGITIGVSTTLIGQWTEKKSVLSPFDGCSTRNAFYQKINQMKGSVLWRRFLSPMVLFDWNERIRTPFQNQITLSLRFNFLTWSYDDISSKILEWATQIHETFEEDSWYESVFMKYFKDSTSFISCPKQLLDQILTRDAHLYESGCIISVPSVEKFHESMMHHIEEIPCTSDLSRTISTLEMKTRQAIKSVQQSKIGSSSSSFSSSSCTDYTTKKRESIKEQLVDRDRRIREIQEEIPKEIPISRDLVINTMEFKRRYHEDGKQIHFTSPLSVCQSGDLLNDPEAWKLRGDFIKGISERLQRYRIKGIGAIVNKKQYYMKCILDLGYRQSSFLVVSTMGSFGLNLKISHAILLEDVQRQGDILSQKILLQVSGRVGRIGQESTGKIHITSPRLFFELIR